MASRHCELLRARPHYSWTPGHGGLGEALALARTAASRGGAVLEVGFGMGISARYIQTHDIGSHTIIEPNWEVFQQLQTFAQKAIHPVEPLLGFWEEVTPSLPTECFSGILFDTYPLLADELHENHFPFFKEAYRLLKPGGVLTYYSDERDSFSPSHRAQLIHAGFSNIRSEGCPVRPPPDCAYWRDDSLLVPIIQR